MDTIGEFNGITLEFSSGCGQLDALVKLTIDDVERKIIPTGQRLW
jgi:hypothetical protein